LNVDLSTVTAAADLVFGVGEPLREILHLELQAGANATKQNDILLYNALSSTSTRCPSTAPWSTCARRPPTPTRTAPSPTRPAPHAVKWTSATRSSASGNDRRNSSWPDRWPQCLWPLWASCPRASRPRTVWRL